MPLLTNEPYHAYILTSDWTLQIVSLLKLIQVDITDLILTMFYWQYIKNAEVITTSANSLSSATLYEYTDGFMFRFRCQYFRNRKKCLSPELDSFVTQQLYHQERVLWLPLFSLSLFNKILKMLHTHAALKFITTKWLGYWKWNVFDIYYSLN